MARCIVLRLVKRTSCLGMGLLLLIVTLQVGCKRSTTVVGQKGEKATVTQEGDNIEVAFLPIGPGRESDGGTGRRSSGPTSVAAVLPGAYSSRRVAAGMAPSVQPAHPTWGGDDGPWGDRTIANRPEGGHSGAANHAVGGSGHVSQLVDTSSGHASPTSFRADSRPVAAPCRGARRGDPDRQRSLPARNGCPDASRAVQLRIADGHDRGD